MLRHILNARRPAKRLVSVIYDVAALTASIYTAWALRLGQLDIKPYPTDYICIAITITVSIFFFIRLGLYRAILRYMSQEAISTIAIGLVISAITLAASSFFLQGSIPRSVPVIYTLTAAFLVGLPRLLVRDLVHILFPTGENNVLIYGAGSAGRMLADSLRPSREYNPVAFIDDNALLHGSIVRGIPVHPDSKIRELIEKYKCSKVFLALGAAERTVKLAIIRSLEQHPIQLQTIPPLEELTKGQVNIQEVRNIQIEELLGRDPVNPDNTLMRTNTHRKVVMVTGAGGSIGSELCRQIIQQKPDTLILFELSEFNLYKIKEEFSESISTKYNTKIVAILGNVQDQDRLEAVMKHFNVQTVYHAAAYKHVPLVEQNIVEGIKNNVLGTWRCATAAHISKVETFVLISTDKAVRSTNIMGSSKRLAEMTIQLASRNFDNTRYATVRFGNVLGSSGSVVPKFRSQIQNGGPVTVTHPHITRYFMTIPEASQLVIQAGAMSRGGETYVLEMGEPVRIADLAKEMIRLSGFTLRDQENPEGDIEINYTGLRPGEKLYEELVISNNILGTHHPRITQALEQDINEESYEVILQTLEDACDRLDIKGVTDILKATENVYSGKGKFIDNLSFPANVSSLRTANKTRHTV